MLVFIASNKDQVAENLKLENFTHSLLIPTYDLQKEVILMPFFGFSGFSGLLERVSTIPVTPFGYSMSMESMEGGTRLFFRKAVPSPRYNVTAGKSHPEISVDSLR